MEINDKITDRPYQKEAVLAVCDAIEKRHRKWDEKYHTLSEEIKGEFTGANREEEVEYGN